MFAEFWAIYPTRNGKKIGKGQCEKLFNKLSDIEKNDCLKATENYSKRQEWPVDPIRFFKSRDYPNGLWREWVTPEVSNGLEGQGSRGAGRRSFAQEREDERRARISGICGLGPGVFGNVHKGNLGGTRNKALDTKVMQIPKMED